MGSAMIIFLKIAKVNKIGIWWILSGYGYFSEVLYILMSFLLST